MQLRHLGLPDRGYITSTPKSADFSKKHEKWPKNERSSCIPQPKIGERPYLAPPKTLRKTPIFLDFDPIFPPIILHP